MKRRSVRVTRRQATSRNPLKALAAREDIKSEYTEVKLGIGEKELKRMKVEERKYIVEKKYMIFSFTLSFESIYVFILVYMEHLPILEVCLWARLKKIFYLNSVERIPIGSRSTCWTGIKGELFCCGPKKGGEQSCGTRDGPIHITYVTTSQGPTSCSN